jgi:TRAP-type C4-dicarboxylate transport system substrate-binding protein
MWRRRIAGIRRRGRLATVFLIGVLVAAGCTAGAGGGDKAGGSGEPVVLRMANGYGSLDFEPAVAWFVKRVGELSRGDLRIQVVDNWVKDSAPQFEQVIVRDTATGKADVAWVGTRVFDTLGVNSFQALTAPMLIDSYPLQQAVIESDIPMHMMQGLGQLHLTGLAVLADGLRKPIGVERPLLGPGDWRGITFAAIRSLGQADVIRALGALPTDIWSHTLDTALDRGGQIQGIEKDLRHYHLGGTEARAPYVTANVNLWPQTVALIANPARLYALTDEQRGWLQRAAQDAAGNSTSLVDGDASIATSICQAGGRFANASPADLAGLRREFAPVYSQVEQDAETSGFIAQIEDLKRSTPPGPALPIPTGCTGSAPRSQGQDDPSVLNGVYRVSWTESELASAGADPTYAREYAGVTTMTLTDGHYVVSDNRGGSCAGNYSVSADTLSLDFDVPGCSGVSTLRWSLGNGRLRLASVPGQDSGGVVFSGEAWTKIG